MTKRAAIYTRISEDREGAGLGVDRQRADCEALAQRLGWAVVAVHADNDISAYSGKPRPGYRALLADLREGRADAVIAWHTDRLHRSPRELEEYVDICDGGGIATHTVKAGPLDLSTPSGRMVARQLGAVARFEVEHAIERARRARLQSATAGRWTGGRRPFGYEADGMTVIPTEADALNAATDAVLAGASLHAIAREWQAAGLKTSTGGEWKPTEVRKALLRPRNAGLMVHQGEIIGRAEWPAVVDEDRWRALHGMLTDPRRRTTTSGARRWLGSGLYRCEVCESPMLTTRGANGALVYRCRTRKHISRDVASLDAYVTGLILERLRQPDAADLAVAPSPDTSGLHAELVAQRQRLDDLAAMYAEGQVDARQLAEGSGRLREKIADLEQQIGNAAHRSALSAFIGANDPADVWDRLDLGRRRAVLDALMQVTVLRARRGRLPGGVYFDPASVAIEWRS